MLLKKGVRQGLAKYVWKHFNISVFTPKQAGGQWNTTTCNTLPLSLLNPPEEIAGIRAVCDQAMYMSRNKVYIRLLCKTMLENT